MSRFSPVKSVFSPYFASVATLFLMGVAAASGCSSPSGGGGGAVLTPCQTSKECSGYPCTNGFCDFALYDAGTTTGDVAVADKDGVVAADVAQADVAVKDAGGVKDMLVTKPDSTNGKPDTAKPIDAGCKTAAGKPCCTNDSQCATKSACTTGTCNTTNGQCVVIVKPNCCSLDSDCGGGDNPCQTASCTVATKTCTFVDADNGDSCDDGDKCTQKDNCVVGKCSGQPLDCDDGDICTLDSCSQGKCTSAKKATCCVKGECCDTNASVFRAKGVQCGTTPALESRCSSDGLLVESRYSFTRCGGDTASCPTTAPTSQWSPWKPVKACPSTAKCIGSAGKFDCETKTTTTSCTSGACCDTTAGKLKIKGSQCSSTVYTSRSFCVDNNIFRIRGYRGCYGTSPTSCSSSSSRLYYAPGVFYKSCQKGQTCYLSGSSAYCGTGNTCTTGVCCDVNGTGAALPKGTPCGTTPISTKTSCGENGNIVARDLLPGCTGKSAICSSSSSYGTYDAAKVTKVCGTGTSCVVLDGTPTCKAFVATKQCSSGTCCDSATKRYKPLGTKCSSSIRSTQYTCAADFKSVRKRTAYRGCTGGSSGCSSTSSAYYAWGPWATSTSCSSKTRCRVGSSSKPYCSSFLSTECSSGTCCSKTKKYRSPRYTACDSIARATRYKCGQSGEKVYVMKAVYGCSGSSSSCSSSSYNYSWGEWALYKTCTGGTSCQQSGSNSANCVTSNGN